MAERTSAVQRSTDTSAATCFQPDPSFAGLSGTWHRTNYYYTVNFKIPKRCYVVGELPRNTMGKVQKNLLREQHKQLFAS